MKHISLRPGPLFLAPLLFAPLIALTDCLGGLGAISLGGSESMYTLSVSPQPASIPINGTVTFTAITNNSAPGLSVRWALISEGDSTVNIGSLNCQMGMTCTYTAPPTLPIPQNSVIPPGTVDFQVSMLGAPTVQFSIAITAPSIITGFSSTLNTVALGKTLTIWAYAAGSTNNAVTMQVNGVTGGSSTYGTITFNNGLYGAYTYTAPATMPMTGDTVTITVISQADPTKSSSMTVTLTSS